MTENHLFIDYYAVLQVNPGCDTKLLEAAYRHLAKAYHPDHPETADVDKFSAVVEAYSALRSPEKRAAYNLLYAEQVDDGEALLAAEPAPTEGSTTALNDAEAQARILLHLYKTRRERAQKAGVGELQLQEMLQCSDDTFEFHRWYLKAKGFIEITDEGMLAITIAGVDHVMTMSRTAMVEKLRISQSH